MAEQNETERKEAQQYWGYLFKENKSGTDLLHRLLQGIGHYIRNTFEPSDCDDLTPSQLAAFYRAVGGDYDSLFIQTPPSSIAFIYQSLGCRHSLQPATEDDDYAQPTVPALKVKGFVTWQTIQLLLGPEEHVPFIQNAVRQFDISDPAEGITFPKVLPKESFPDKPDERMVEWYEGVSEKLRREAEAEEQRGAREAENSQRRVRSSSELSRDGSGNERSDAADYFSNPLYRNREGRPAIVRRYSRKPQSPRRFVQEQGRVMANTVRHIVSPHLWSGRRRSFTDRYGTAGGAPNQDEEADDTDRPPPTALHSRPSTHRPRPAVRISSASRPSSSSSDSDSSPRRRRQHHRTVQRQRTRSYEPPRRTQDRQTPPYAVHPASHLHRHPSEQRRSDRPAEPATSGYGPSASPIFASRVPRGPPHPYHERRGSLPSRPTYSGSGGSGGGGGGGGGGGASGSGAGGGGAGGYGRPTARYHADEMTAQRREAAGGARRSGGPYGGSPGRERDWERDRERDGSGLHRYVVPSVNGVGGRRYPVEAPWR